ncbi:MAG: ROK family protein [Mycoplasmatales bacterium]
MYLVFDIGGTFIKYGFFNQTYKLISKGKITTPRSLEAMLDEMEKVVKTEPNLLGISISAPGAVDPQTGIIGGYSTLWYIHGPNFKQLFKERFGFEIAIDNDANCAALAEVHFGSSKEYKNCLYIVLGTGIGGSVIIDRKIQRGKNLFGGEFGFMFVNDNLENVSATCSTRVLMKEINAIEEFKAYSGIDAFNSTDSRIIEIIKRFCRRNAMFMFNLQYALDPDVIILGGGISDNPRFYQMLMYEVDKVFAESIAGIRPNIIIGEYKADANLFGALANLVYWEWHFLINCFKIIGKLILSRLKMLFYQSG